MFQFINFRVFLISLSIGLVFVYLSSSPHKIVYVYPTPNNLKQVEYIDKADNCFQFEMNKTQCPANNQVKQIPIQK